MERSYKRRGLTQTGSDEGNKFTSRTSKQIEDYHSGGKKSFTYKKNDRGKIIKIPQMLTGGQSKIAAKAPPTNKIDAKDFAVLRAEKAKGRGMGLQDEKVKPGKVMKAKRGQFSKSSKGTTAKSAKGKTFAGYSKVFKTGVSAGDKAKATSTIIGVKPTLPEAAKSSKVARRVLKAAQATSLGKKLLLPVAAGVAATQYLKSKMKKKDEPKKKMGGGMMQRPMGYASGTPKGGIPNLPSFLKDEEGNPIPRKKKGPMRSKTSKDSTRDKKDFVGYMGGGMMKVPGYSSGTTDPIKTFSPNTKRPPEKRQKKLSQQARRSLGKRAGVGALGGTGNEVKFKNVKPKMKVVIIGGSKKSLTGQGGLERDAENKPYRYSYSTDPMLKGATIVNARMAGGMMNKPMGYKSGKSIKVKCKLGKNKPTKMY